MRYLNGWSIIRRVSIPPDRQLDVCLGLYATVEEFPIGRTLADLRMGERRHSDCRNSRAHFGPGNTCPRHYLDLETMMLWLNELTI